ncbi:MAG TPA: ATP-binding cassette domain-containing protein [Actinomycetota bacterium]|nr:ATP-binding cassette domain-containing protein [Actinomycetota bacterium]
MSAVVLDRVTFTYPERDRPVLSDVRLELPEGVFALVCGPTGAGKSTLLRLANGLVPHFSGGTFAGRVMAAGRDTRSCKPREMADVVAFVPQDPGSSFVLDRVEDEIAYGMENLGVQPRHMRRRVEEMLDLFGLASLRDRSVRAISGGERQRVAIAAALAPGARIVVLDEPTSQLDPQGAEDVLAALQRLVHDHGMTVVAAEHRLERIAGFADVAVLVEGGTARADEPRSILGRVDLGPPVARLGAALGWSPLPVTVREARRHAAARPPVAPPAIDRPSPGDVLMRAEGASYSYGGRVAIDRVDLEVRAGEAVALMGRNGAGKTTLLRLLGGMTTPTEGRVLSDGAAPRTGRDVALCPQEPESVLFRSSVREEIEATPGAQTDRVLDEFGLTDLSALHPRDLSAGQRLLVAAAAVAATGAPVLLLDEPTRGLDPEAKERLVASMRRRASAGGAVVFATHDVELVASAATRVVMLAAGQVVAEGSPEEVLGDSAVFAPQTTRVFGPGWLTPDQVIASVR